MSAVLASEYLEKTAGWAIESFVPVNYDLRPTWASAPIHPLSAVVDFLYHPQAKFWFDHHATAFHPEQLRDDYEQRRKQDLLVLNRSARSCASVIWKQLHRELPERFASLVQWADKIDTADYVSVEEAIFGVSPALQINLSLLAPEPEAFCQRLIPKLRKHDLAEVAETKDVRLRYMAMQRGILAGLRKLKKRIHLADGGVATFDAETSGGEVISRYAAYHFFPDARYSVGVVRSAEGIKITAMRNPWRNFRSVSLGRMFQRFGGGGHQRVGAVIVPPEQSERVKNVVDTVLSRLQ